MTDPVVIEARRSAYQLALDTLFRPNSNPQPDEILKCAKQIETWFWGGFAPIERAPTPLGDIEECATATRARVSELAQNSADSQLQADLIASLASYERFIADVHSAIQRAQERAGRPQ